MKKIEKTKVKKWFKEEGIWYVGVIVSSVIVYGMGYKEGRKKGDNDAWNEIIKHVTRTGSTTCRLGWKDGRELYIHMYID